MGISWRGRAIAQTLAVVPALLGVAGPAESMEAPPEPENRLMTDETAAAVGVNIAGPVDDGFNGYDHVGPAGAFGSSDFGALPGTGTYTFRFTGPHRLKGVATWRQQSMTRQKSSEAQHLRTSGGVRDGATSREPCSP